MAKPTRTIRVFIASPGDLAVERSAFKQVIDELNNGFGRGCDVVFKALGWEETLSHVGRRPQDVINKEIDSCDVFLLAMFRRWGQKAPDAKKRGFSSYTEEEFYRALARMEKTTSPTIFAFFKHIDSGEMASPGPDLKRVLRFRKKLEASKQVLWRGFKDEAEFRQEVDKHLTAFAKGELEPPNEPISETLLPDSAIAEIKKWREKAARETERAEVAEKKARGAAAKALAAERRAEARAAQEALRLAESAAKAALDGKIEQARQDFAKALDGTTNLDVLSLAWRFFYRIGELDEAERLLRRWLSISGPNPESAETAGAYGNLGVIEDARGNLNAAEEYHKTALTINEKIGRQEGMATQYGNLGVIEGRRGNLDAAEAYLKKSLAIDEKLGQQEGMASAFGNLSLIERKRGNLDAAEAYLKKSLAINEKLGRQEGMAAQYGNLGLIERRRGNLEVAEAYHKKAIAINEKLGKQDGMATQYGNLGLIEIARGNLDEAEAYLKKSRTLAERLGLQEGMANQYANLGVVEKQRGNKREAQRWWSLARDVYKKIGATSAEQEVQGWIDDLS